VTDAWAWAAVVAFILGLLALDLLVFHRDAHAVTTREAAAWSAVWITVGVAFAGVVWATLGGVAAGEYLGGYLIEKSLSVDNIFLFALLFSYFRLPSAYQHRVLFWGVLGALMLRAIFIAAGAALMDNFHWTGYLFGAFLVVTGVKMARHGNAEIHPDRNPFLRLVRRVIPMTPDYRGQRFFVRRAGRRLATPLLAVLVVVETTDVLFAVDSIPAIFAVTTDPFLVFTSNAFAILGLRALYFLLAGIVERFVHLKLGLAAVLVFVGAKMLATDIYTIPIWTSLVVITLLIGTSMAASLRTVQRAESLPVDPSSSSPASAWPPPMATNSEPWLLPCSPHGHRRATHRRAGRPPT
jgi:tellurite resistance protein TerC